MCVAALTGITAETGPRLLHLCENGPMSRTAPQRPWLFGAIPDLLLGSGLGYIAIFMIFAFGGESLRLAHPLGLVPLVSVLISTPHYGATLLRVYERPEDRRAHIFVAVWATLLVTALFAWSIHDAWVASWFFMIYATWSPYHYTRQNYGVGTMFLRRAGVEISSRARQLLNVSFLSSFAITFFVLHTVGEATYDPSSLDYASSVGGRALGLPIDLGHVAIALAWVVYLGSTLAALVLLARVGSLKSLAPTITVVLTQALWFPLPFSISFFGIQTGIDPLDAGLPPEYVFYAAIGHALQYQFVTAYFAKASNRWRGLPLYVGKCLAAGGAIWAIPAIAFSPDLLGDREFNLGLAGLIAAGVNIHHFILDGAIWKLRSQRVSKVLVAAERDDEGAAGAAFRTWPSRLAWTLGGLLMATQVAAIASEQITLPRAFAENRLESAGQQLSALRWLGRDDSARQSRMAVALARSGDLDAAEAHASRSLELGAHPDAWLVLANARAEREDWDGVIESYDASLTIDGTGPAFQHRQLALHAYYETDRQAEARVIFQELLAGRAPGRALAAVAGVAREAGDWPVAVFGYREALERDPALPAAANNLAWILATSRDPRLRNSDEAIEHAQAAVRSSDPPNADYLDTLAMAYASGGRWREAVTTQTRAIDLMETAGNTKAAAAMKAQRALFEEQMRPSERPLGDDGR